MNFEIGWKTRGEFVGCVPLHSGNHILRVLIFRVEEDDIEDQTTALREKLLAEDRGRTTDARGLKSHQVHELAKAKIEESERLRRALGIKADYEEGQHWKRPEGRSGMKDVDRE